MAGRQEKRGRRQGNEEGVRVWGQMASEGSLENLS